MPFVSIVLPVYGVEDYLAECLDSIVSQSFEDFEIVAVDDCSPDRCNAILADYAARDSRLRVVTLSDNVGLGRARNAGLRQAIGEFIWFLDSDDWIEPGSLKAIVNRARENSADIVLFSWERRHPNRPAKAGGHQDVLAKAPAAFRLDDYPQLIRIAPFSWNKMVRRSLIDELDYEFEVGQYQDIDYTFVMLAAASRITTLNLPCIAYRQRDTAVTRKRSNGHFDLFAHWTRAFELIDAHQVGSEKIRTEMYRHMTQHMFFVYYHPDRLPNASASRYLEHMHWHYARFAPVFLPQRSTRERLRDLLISKGLYFPISVWRWYNLSKPRRAEY